jgi:hypothetical protein
MSTGSVAGSTLSGAGAGALAGSVIPGLGTVVGGAIGAGVGLIGGLFGNSEANAMQEMAMAQLEEQRRMRELALGFAKPSTEELLLQGRQLAQLDQYMTYQSAELERAQKMLQTIDPTIMETSKQILSLAQGGSSPLLAPMERRREEGKLSLNSRINEEMGYGGAMSTAGRAALGGYDQQTGEILAQNRFNIMGGLGNIQGQAMNSRNAVMGGINQNTAMGASLIGSSLGTADNFSKRQMSAVLGTSLTPYAGAGSMGDFLSAQQGKQSMNGLVSAGATMGMMSMLKGSPLLGGAAGGGGASTSLINQANQQSQAAPRTIT